MLLVPRLLEWLQRGQDSTNRLPTANWLIPSITSERAPQSEADPAAIWERSAGPHREMLYKDKARFVWKMLNVLHAGQPRNCLQEIMSNLPRNWANLFWGHTWIGQVLYYLPREGQLSTHRLVSKHKHACTQREKGPLLLLPWVHVPTIR